MWREREREFGLAVRIKKEREKSNNGGEKLKKEKERMYFVGCWENSTVAGHEVNETQSLYVVNKWLLLEDFL